MPGNETDRTDKSLLMEAFLAHSAAQKTHAPSPDSSVDVGGRGDADRIIGSRPLFPGGSTSSHGYSAPAHMIPPPAPIRVMTQPSAPPYLPPHAWPAALHDAGAYQVPSELYQLSPAAAARMHFRPIAPAHYRRLATQSPLRQGYAKHSPRTSERATSAGSSRERHTSERSSDSRHSSGTGCSEKTNQSGTATCGAWKSTLTNFFESYSETFAVYCVG